MPLLHQDNSRGGGSPSDRQSRSHRSVSEILDSMLPDNVRAPAVARNECGIWWDSPASPEAAQTPSAMVPAACFPPQHPRAYTSFSESAQPGGGGSSTSAWNGSSSHVLYNGAGHGIQDLMTSLKALSMVNATAALTEVAGNVSTSPQNTFDTEQWSTDQQSKGIQLRNKRTCGVERRRASFCGAVGNGCSVLRWSGRLPVRTDDPEGGFSAKLFIGGLPWDITEITLTHALKPFQPVHMEWPERAQGCSPRGFAYVTLDSEKRVRALLAACRRDRCEWYYRLQSRKMRYKEVQVIPWAVADANWSAVRSTRLEASRTVFVGALHGMLSAGTLAMIMNDLFSGVVYAGIDTDKNKYPIGSGRVTFDNVRSYVRAISAAFIEIHTDKFTKKVQIDPYLEDSMCTVCNLQQGPYFCREPTCFGYFCRSCWSWQHGTDSGLASHKELMRNSKSSALATPRPALPPASGGTSRPALALSPAYVSQPHNEYGLFNGHYAVRNEMDGSQSPPASATSGICSATSDADPLCEERVLWHAL